MFSVALLLRLSTMLLVPLLVVTGLGTTGNDRPADTDSEVAAHARAVVASASGDLQPADAGAAAPQARPERVATPGAAQEAEADKTAAKEEAARAKEKAEDETAAAAAPADVRPRSLYLGVGHGRAANGRWQPGAEHPNGTVEVDAAQIMVDAMVEVLKDAPGVQLTFESGDHPNVIGSVAAANAAGVDDCIEVHQDTAAAPPGAFAHWYPGATAAHQLANRMIDSVEDRGVAVRRDWHRARPGLYWLRKSTCRAVLLEIGRVGDFGPDKLRELGRGMAQAYLHDTAEARNVAPPA